MRGSFGSVLNLTALIFEIALDVPSDELYDYRAPAGIDVAPTPGTRVLVPFRTGHQIGMVFGAHTVAEPVDERMRTVDAVLDDVPAPAPEWIDLIRFASSYYQRGVGETAIQTLPMALRDAGRYARDESGQWRSSTLERRFRQLDKAAAGPRAGLDDDATMPELTDEQRAAMGLVDAHQPLLLQGVTGSGKTEVYLRAVEATVLAGSQALVLVPEINLTPQLVERFRQRFAGRRIVTLHSKLAEGERLLAWLSAARGTADIVLGTRLAIFTPMPRLGLIVVDEEHEASYKQQEGLRHSARDLAVWRARALSVPIILGSATPSLETYANAKAGRYGLARLDKRARSAARLPSVELIDTGREASEQGLTPTLRAALEQTLARGEQSLVFLNRRGYAPVLACSSCGWVAGCAACSANVVVHLGSGRQPPQLRCHHCGWAGPVPRRCPTCGNADLAPLGRVTQRTEEHIAALLPTARIARVDADSTRRKGAAAELFDQMHAGALDMLIGTQMIAKGHDFARVTVVGILGADAALFSHDFRAAERLFQQLMQVAGRSGRADLPGRVLVQTRYPDHPLFASLIAHDYDGFAEAQLAERHEAGLPPYAHQALLRVEARQIELALAFAAQARELGLSVEHDGVRLYDPVPMTLTRLAHVERAQLLVESPSRRQLQAFLPRWITALGGRGQSRRGAVKWQVEVDPIEI
ncbi:primosomal protein N' [soil metagenome]